MRIGRCDRICKRERTEWVEETERQSAMVVVAVTSTRLHCDLTALPHYPRMSDCDVIVCLSVSGDEPCRVYDSSETFTDHRLSRISLKLIRWSQRVSYVMT
jgi:hypothetical protein